MSIIDASLLIISGLFGFYALAAAVEYGIVIKMLGRKHNYKHMFTPLWEVTNVFLVFGFTGLSILFNSALGALSRDLLGLLSFALVAIVIRASIVLAIFYNGSSKPVPTWLTWLFGITTMLIPLVFAAAGIYLLTGQMFWQSLLGAVLFISSFVGLSSVGLNVLERKSSRHERLPAQLSAVVWLMLLGSVLPIISLHTINNLSPTTLVIVVVAAAGILGLMLLSFVRRSNIWLWQALCVTCVALPMLLAWADRPYLISGKFTLVEAYGATSYGSAIVIGLAIMAPLILVGLYWFVKLIGSSSAPPTIYK